MSRGHGAVERAILKAVQHRFVALPTVVALAGDQWDWANQSVRQSFTRAARNLRDQGLIQIGYYPLPVGIDGLTGEIITRDTMCVAEPDRDLTRERYREEMVGGYQRMVWRSAKTGALRSALSH
jgi:hypothetical protein